MCFIKKKHNMIIDHVTCNYYSTFFKVKKNKNNLSPGELSLGKIILPW